MMKSLAQKQIKESDASSIRASKCKKLVIKKTYTFVSVENIIINKFYIIRIKSYTHIGHIHFALFSFNYISFILHK